MAQAAEATETNENKKPDFDPRVKRSIFDIVQDLSKDIPLKYLKKRKQGGKDITYIPWGNATKLLDYYASGWTYEIKEVMNISPNVVITCRITIPAMEGNVFREATGHEAEDKDNWGDPYSNSESKALRRAAAKFGLGRYLYDDDDPPPSGGQNRNQNQNRNPPPSNKPNNPPPQTNANAPASQSKSGGPTEGQLKYLGDLSLKKEVSESDICDRFSDGKTLVFDELTKAQAASAITWLKELQ